MEIANILSKVDHTILKQEATWEGIKKLCDEGMKYHTASVCIAPTYVKQATEYIKNNHGNLKVCTVIGFPNGYNTTETKVFETKNAMENGAEEIDMVINIGWLKDGLYDNILNEIREIKKACGNKILKVIIETCLLTEEEKIKMCEIVSKSGAEYIKTSTGFSTAGATFEDVELMVKQVKKEIKVKAAGGISSLGDAKRFITIGAERLGTSRIVKIVESE